MSDTPRTDAIAAQLQGTDIHYWWQSYEHLARHLEHELAEASAAHRALAALVPGGVSMESGSLASASSETAAPGDELPLRCAFENGAISISVGEKALAHATNINPALYDGEKDRGTFRVTNNAVFAEEVVRELNREREDGSTMLTDTLDKAVYEAINQGAEGVEEVK